MDYIFKTGEVKTGALILDSNKEELKAKYIEISRNIIQKGKVLYRDTKFTLYSDKEYILLDIPTEIKDRIGRMIPIVCIFSLKDIKKNYRTHGNNLDMVINEVLKVIERTSTKNNYPISDENKERLREILKSYLPDLIGRKRIVYKVKKNSTNISSNKNIKNIILTIITVIVAFFTSIFGIKR